MRARTVLDCGIEHLRSRPIAALEVPTSQCARSLCRSRSRPRAAAACRLVKPAKGALWRFFETPCAPLAALRRSDDAARIEIARSRAAAEALAAAAFTSPCDPAHAPAARALAPHTTTSRVKASTTKPIATQPIYTESDHMPAGRRTTRANTGTPPISMSERTAGSTSAPTSRYRAGSTRTNRTSSSASFARELTAEERLPYTLAIHAGRDADGNEHNPHAHLMVSERRNDGIERVAEQWFRRANRAESGTRRRAEEPHVSRPRMAGARAGAMGDADERSAPARRSRRARRSPQLRAPGYRPGAWRPLRSRSCRHGRPRAVTTTASTTPPGGPKRSNGWLTWKESWSRLATHLRPLLGAVAGE